jgi:tRNA(adenine34) deaminase
MALAIEQARIAGEQGEVPVGAVVVLDDVVVSKAHNLREQSNDPTAHAETIALQRASKELGAWRLSGCDLYVTLEPCTMCAGAMVLARIHRLVFGAFDPKAGACGSLFSIPTDERLNHRIEVISGVSKETCSELLSEFFRARRKSK